MMRIRSGVPAIGVKRFRNRNIRIQEKQAEINRIHELEKEGLISPEDARLRIALLEAQIKELEFGVPDGGESDVEVEKPPEVNGVGSAANMPAGMAINNDPMLANPVEGSDATGNNDAEDAEYKEYGKNDYYSSHADSMKVFHGLTGIN